jgi:hypothetical protein
LFQFPDETALLQEWFKTRTISQLAGFENNEQDGEGDAFNFILSNGTRSTQYDEDSPTDYTHMIPTDALNKIRRVTIYDNACWIGGFSFFDKDGAILWKHGETLEGNEAETVLLAEKEVIVGVVAKLFDEYQSLYTDF